MRTPLLLLSLLVSGCIQDLVAQGAELAPDSDTYAASSSTGEPETPTTSLDTDVHTVTGGITTGEPGTGTGSPPDVPPEIDVFDGIPDHISEAGPVFLQLLASADVTAVRLSLDEQVLAKDLTLDQFPWKHEFLSAADNGPARIFKVVVEDDEGLTATAQATVRVELPVSGAQKCMFEDPERGVVISGISAVEYTPDAIVGVGVRDSGAGPHLSVWKLDPDTCELKGGWPRTLLDWTGDPALEKLASVGVAVDVDVDGNYVVGGNLIVGGEPRSYVALLDASGELVWEHAGTPGDEVMGVAAATGQFKNRVFVVGARRTDDNPVRTDGAIWVYQADLDEVFVAAPTILAAPFTANEADPDGGSRSEWVRAVVLDPDTGNALAVGEREFRPNAIILANRAFTVLVHPLGEVIGAPWTSPADTWFFHDAARSVAACGDGFIAGGWTRDDLNDAEPQPMIFWIDPDGTSEQRRPEVQLAPSQTHGIACDRLGKIVSAGTRTVEPTDAQVFMVAGPDGPRTTYEAGVQGDDGAAAVACDARGFCGWGGHRTVDAKPYAVVRVHHP